jgi:hypothetical protein
MLREGVLTTNARLAYDFEHKPVSPEDVVGVELCLP